jgi:hypothetical protein
MKKEDFLKLLREANEVKKAEDTIANIDSKEVDGVNVAPGVKGLDSELPTQKAVEKEVAKDEGPVIPVNADGISKDGGNSDKLEPGKVEAERKKEDNGMKDVLNVSSRKVEENSEVQNELLAQLKEAAAREENYKKQLVNMKKLCEDFLAKQAADLEKGHAAEMKKVFEAVIEEGKKFEDTLKEASAKNEKMYKTAQKMYESSTKLNKILIEAVKKSQPEKKMVRTMSATAAAIAAFKK